MEAVVEGQQTGTEQHWTETSANETLHTPEAKTALGKFATPDDVAVGYMELQKKMGGSYRLPESLDKITDEKARGEFKASVGKLMGAVDKPEDLKDINFTAGMPEGSKANEQLVGLLSKTAVEKHWPKEVVQQGVELWNGAMAQAAEQQQIAWKQNADNVNAELEKTYPGKVAEKTELVKRMFMNYAGVSTGDFEKVGEGMVKAGFTADSVFAKALIHLAELFQEGTTENGQGKPNFAVKEQAPGAATGDEKTYHDLGWDVPKKR